MNRWQGNRVRVFCHPGRIAARSAEMQIRDRMTRKALLSACDPVSASRHFMPQRARDDRSNVHPIALE
jgi:hypothetical protein